MRQTGMTLVAVAALMTLGAQVAEAGITCKVIPSWCPGGRSHHVVNNKSQTVGYTNHGSSSSQGGPGEGGPGAGGKGGDSDGGKTPGLGTPSLPMVDTGQHNSKDSDSQGNSENGNGGTPGGSGGAPGNSGTTPGSSAPTSVPEPATLLLLGFGAGAAGIAAFRRRKKD